MKSSSSKSLQTMFDPVLPDVMLPRDCLLEQGWSPVPLNPFKLSLILFTWCFAPYGLFTGTRMESSSSESLQTMFDPVLPDAMLPRDCLLEQGWSPVLQNPFKTIFDPVLPDAILPRDCLLEQGWSPVPRNPFKLSGLIFHSNPSIS